MARFFQIRLNPNVVAHVLALTAMTFIGLIVLGLGRPGQVAGVADNAVATRGSFAF